MYKVHLHLVIYQTLLSRATYSKYRDIPPEASRVKCLAQGHNVNLHAIGKSDTNLVPAKATVLSFPGVNVGEHAAPFAKGHGICKLSCNSCSLHLFPYYYFGKSALPQT